MRRKNSPAYWQDRLLRRILPAVEALSEARVPCRRLLSLPSICEMPRNPQRLRVSSFGHLLTIQVFVLSHCSGSRLPPLRKRRQARILRRHSKAGPPSPLLNRSVLLARQPPTATPA